jgi:hypothetical protein
MPIFHRNIEFPQGDYVAHKKEKAAKTWESLERQSGNQFSNRIKITNQDGKVNMKVGGGKC